MMTDAHPPAPGAVAVIGMSGRFPGAPSLAAYWDNLRTGACSLTDFSEAELVAAGVDASQVRRPEYVRTKGWLADADRFDHAHFGFNKAEAAALDPQARLLLETAWSTLEDGGHDPRNPPLRTGVYVGGGVTEHMLAAHTDPALGAALGGLQIRILTDREFLAPWISYRLGLQGPGVGVQTACSTSLSAVHLATQALLLGECDAALAGGASVDAVAPRGYLHQPGGIYSPDGRCRPFDERAAGTVPGNGVGLVLLRRLDDALADGDPIRAVIRGTAMTNDGARKVGFTAPGVEGQTAAIVEAWAAAGLDPAQAQYLEAHGTGTELGDQVEISAAAAAFADAAPNRIVLGSVKANIGHLDAAAGVAALVKTALMLQHRTLVPSHGVTRPNPKLGLESGPFRLVREAEEWTTPDGTPRRAGVTCVGIGGTNVHLVLEEAPRPLPGSARRTPVRTHTFDSQPFGALSLRPDEGTEADTRAEDTAAEDLKAWLAGLFTDALGLDGPDDLARTYFACGGDSLTAVHLVGQISDGRGLNVPLTLFLDDVPLRELIDRIAEDSTADPLDSFLDEIEAER
ncbi:beta-ketoacyl synthase N-terminal-like domain-containing protein [Streptomyces sp. NPDC046805]|uniref:beta-ketoacyl synthase N-terminal-like domain-containing protein n=1 Tax=Streptomyces sp. NPDC046805 TaxID=3155134 RepID=UPI0033C8500E